MAVSLNSDALAGIARWSDVGDAARGLTLTLEDEKFPGAIVPAVREDGAHVFYALAGSGPAWRRLQPLLVAFAGATFTDFEGAPTVLDHSDPLEQYFAGAGLHAVARMLPGTYANGSAVALRALKSLQDAVARAPDLVTVRPEPTSILLARLQDALNAHDVEAARAVHDTLRAELRLDAQNLLQLEFQISAASGDWAAIAGHRDFELLSASGPSPATAEILLEALYWTFIHESAGEAQPLIDEALVRSLLNHVGLSHSSTVEALINLVSPEEASQAISKSDDIVAVEELVEEQRQGPPEVAQTAPIEQPVETAPAHQVQEAAPQQTIERDALSQARAALLALAAVEGGALTQAETEAVTAVQRLSAEEEQDLLSRPVFRALWTEIEARLGTIKPPGDWAGWLTRLDDPDFEAMDYARRAASEWRLPNTDVDAAAFAALANAIDSVPDGLAGDRLNQSLPYLVEWAAADPAWPRPSLCPIYLSLLTRIALSTRRGETMIKSAALLLESALRSGISASEYRDSMDAVSVIASEALNRNTAYDVFELADVATSYPAVDQSAMTDAITATVTSALSLFDRLSEGQRLAVSRLAAQIGWETRVPAPTPETHSDMAVALSTLSVGVYTLTETAGRNAKAVLAAISPGIKVELNHDHDATAALGNLVARVDLFVVAWASAKHAATNFIKSRRKSKPLVYALGKGASSLIRAVEDYLSRERN